MQSHIFSIHRAKGEAFYFRASVLFNSFLLSIFKSLYTNSIYSAILKLLCPIMYPLQQTRILKHNLARTWLADDDKARVSLCKF